MEITIKDFDENFEIGDIVSAKMYVDVRLSGFGYGAGQLEYISDSIGRHRDYISKLTDLLLDKGLVTEDELLEMI